MDTDLDLIDPSTGIELCPSFHGDECPGNGEHPGLECCCDECDYYLFCFPDWNLENFYLQSNYETPLC